MTIYYLDPVSGNDASAGTSWGAAWKTFVSGPTAARTAAGDVIRIAKSPDPTSVGSATWTDKKIGNSITFGTAPTTQIDTCKASWVGLTGGTVTNANATAYVTPVTAGGSTQGALQVVTSASSTLAYKNLPSTTDFSANQQVCFWYRSSTSLDLTGAQNVFINLCSGTGGSTVVNACAMPKWNYSANVWYPIVIDTGGALGSSIQSVSITTTSNTSQTFYFDEMFASPSGGLTLWSLISPQNTLAGAWYAIRAIRGTDVWLLGNAQFSTAAGATGVASLNDISWNGTTGSYTTYKRETSKFGNPTTTFPTLTPQKAGTLVGTTITNITFSGGWDTSSSVQNGDTILDNIGQVASGHSNGTYDYLRYENIIFCRTAGGWSMSNRIQEWSNIGGIAVAGTYWAESSTSYSPLMNRTLSMRYVIGCANSPNVFTSASNAMFTLTIGDLWGNSTTTIGSNAFLSNITLGRLSSNNTNGYFILGGSSSSARNTFNTGDISFSTSNVNPVSNSWNMLVCNGDNNVYNITSINQGTTTGSTVAAMYFNGTRNCVVNVPVINGAGPLLYCNGQTANCTENVINGVTFNGGAVFAASAYSAPPLNQKVYFHNYGGVAGASRAYVGFYGAMIATPDAALFQLQAIDVHTSGSKAWQYTTPSGGVAAGSIGTIQTLKLASVAAVSGKLVTVSAYVKRSVAHTVGVLVDASTGFVPGYTSDITANCSGSTGAYEQVTLTFTPTADCVFDVYANVIITSASGLTAIWDDLSITQAP